MSDQEQPESISNEEINSAPSDTSYQSLFATIKNLRPESILPTLLQKKLGSFSRIGASALIILIAGGVGYGAVVIDQHLNQPKQHFQAKIVPFAVVSTSPTNGRTDLSNVASITMEFNKPVDPASLKGDFWIFPVATGTFTQTKKTEAIFTPDTPLTPGTAYNVMVHAEFKNLGGSSLGADYHFNFTTATPDHSVIFNSNSSYDRQSVGSVQVGHEEIYTLSVGSQVDATGAIAVYKADEPALLNSLSQEASKQGANQYNDGLFMNRTIDTTNLTQVQSQPGISDGDQLKLDLPVGVYAIVATADNIQVGNSWLVVTDLGVALRQDDQKVVIAVSSLTSSQPVKADLQLYNFFNAQQVIAKSTIDGVGEIPLPYDAGTSVDWVVANYNDQFAIVPLNVQYTLADIRVNADLSKATQAFGLTDKPTYAVGDRVNFSGFVVSDNDVHYQLLANRQFHVYVASAKNGPHLWDSSLSTDSNGRLSGSFLSDASLLDSLSYPDDSVDSNGNTSNAMIAVDSGDFGIFIEDGSSSVDFISGSQVASFTLLRKTSLASPQVKVQFSKASYLSTDTVSATVTVLKADGSRLANGEITAQVYSQSFSEGEEAPPVVTDDNLGEPITADSFVLNLDEHGQTTIPISVSSLPAGSSQVVTLQATITDDSNQSTSAGRGSTIIHQGDGGLSFGPTKGTLSPNGTLVSRVYAKTLTGAPIPNAQIQFSLTSQGDGTTVNPDAVIASGSAVTDATGLAVITQNIGDIDPATNPNLSLDVWTGDSQNNKIEAFANYYVEAADTQIGHSDLQLSQLDISGVPTSVAVGQTLNLNVNTPTDIHALVSIDRGRIYKYETVDLKQGDNAYTIVVTPDMLPSFNLSFSYFSNGSYRVEGQSFNVAPDPKLLKVQVHPDQKSYKAGTSASFAISTLDSTGAPVKSGIVVGVVNESMYDLNKQPVGDISRLYSPKEMTINSSSSLTGRGSGFSGCGGGGNGYGSSASSLNPTGSAIYWNPQMSTGLDGSASFTLKLPKGTWRVFVYSIDQAVDVGSSYIDVTSK